MQEVSANRAFGGWVRTFKHASTECGCDMTFAIYEPPAITSAPVPVVMYLSGLTCTCDNFMQKAGAQRMASQLGIALIAPDTSPRGLGIEGEDDSYDFGTGAGFYVDATEPKWKQYRMYSYVTKELPELLARERGQLDLGRMSIMGHSMGGHGALTVGLRNVGKFASISAFAPICNPINCAWGQKAFAGYLGQDKALWAEYDACVLLGKASGAHPPILVDQGTGDNFYKEGQLQPEALQEADQGKGQLTVRMQEDYDHSYYFMATFMEDHLRFHAKAFGLIA